MLKILLHLLLHPKLLLSLLKPEHIKNYLYLVFKASSDERYRVINYYRSLTGSKPTFGAPGELSVEQPATASIDVTDRVFPKFESVDVSIIVPVYNQWNHTDSCLRSIIATVKNVNYEVILADDGSQDETVDANSLYKNLKYVRNAQNLGFLRNCNHAAEMASGNYLVFLNNDTVVHENWLSALFSLMEKQSDVAIAGSKLLYPDGSLQEAGGVIWNNGDGWNYGRYDDPGKPEYNYTKNVDYVSGASIMVRRDFWLSVGGFDERYTPAYYEDTDLAFEAVTSGYRVVYHPQSVVTHYEGKSHGTDENTGIKAYQAENREKFVNKWRDKLKAEHFPPSARRLFHARDRSSRKRTILVIDHYVPWFDQDAGSRSTFMYLQFLVEKGYNVKFIGDNFYPHQPYTETLQEMGIEVLYGNYYAKHWQDWVVDHASELDVVYLHRPHIAPKYIDFIKENTDAKIVYQCHDLHHLRINRDYKNTGDMKLLEEAGKWETIEKELFSNADIGLTFSHNEKLVLDDWNIETRIEQVPLFLYDKGETDSAPPFSSREGIMFVGGFNHKPNTEGVNWFLSEVLPIVHAQLPELVFNIVGSEVPESIRKKASERVVVHGRLSDDALHQLYRDCKVNVLPLLHGAGVKGKLIESMQIGTPVVSTSVGLEGINADSYGLDSFDKARDFADAIVTLITDESQWKATQSNMEKAFSGNFSKLRFAPKAKEIF